MSRWSCSSPATWRWSSSASSSRRTAEPVPFETPENLHLDCALRLATRHLARQRARDYPRFDAFQFGQECIFSVRHRQPMGWACTSRNRRCRSICAARTWLASEIVNAWPRPVHGRRPRLPRTTPEPGPGRHGPRLGGPPRSSAPKVIGVQPHVVIPGQPQCVLPPGGRRTGGKVSLAAMGSPGSGSRMSRSRSRCHQGRAGRLEERGTRVRVGAGMAVLPCGRVRRGPKRTRCRAVRAGMCTFT